MVSTPTKLEPANRRQGNDRAYICSQCGDTGVAECRDCSGGTTAHGEECGCRGGGWACDCGAVPAATAAGLVLRRLLLVDGDEDLVPDGTFYGGTAPSLYGGTVRRALWVPLAEATVYPTREAADAARLALVSVYTLAAGWTVDVVPAAAPEGL